MASREPWHRKLTAWAGWLLAAGLLAVLAAGALSLSPDGARLRRLAGTAAARNADDRGASLYGGGRGGHGPKEGSRTEAASAVDRREHQGQAPEDGAYNVGRTYFEGGPSRVDEAGGKTEESKAAEEDGGSQPLEAPAEGTHGLSETRQAAAISQTAQSAGCIRAEVMGEARQAQVLLDGGASGVAPVLFEDVSPGVHTLTFVLGDQLWDEEVRVSAGDTTLAVCSPPDLASHGNVFVEPYRDARGTVAGTDSVCVDGEYKGRGEMELDLSSGYHSMSFGRSGSERRYVVLFVPPGSTQYVSPPSLHAPISMNHAGPEREGRSVSFTLRVSPSEQVPSDVQLCFVPTDVAPLKTARMTRRTSDGAFVAVLGAGTLSAREELSYFFRATLPSGDEIDSPVYKLNAAEGRLSGR